MVGHLISIAGVAAALAHAPAQPVAGVPFTERVTVRNVGIVPALRARATYSAPSLGAPIALPAGCSAGPVAGTFTCQAGFLLPGASRTFDFAYAEPAGTYSAQAAVSALVEFIAGDYTASDTIVVREISDLDLHLSANDPVAPGHDIALTFAVHNSGPGMAGNVQVDLFGLGAGDGPFAVSAGALSASNCVALADRLRCTMGDTAPASTRTETLPVHTPATGDHDHPISAVVLTTSYDPPAGSSAAYTLRVRAPV
jgi:hypothetical protein